MAYDINPKTFPELISVALIASINALDWSNILNESAEVITHYGGAVVVLLTLGKFVQKFIEKRRNHGS